jgi:molecular chaperone GrpE (heat shock protein)
MRLLSRLFSFVLESLRLAVLRVQVRREKARAYDAVVETVDGLRRALRTQRRAQDELRRQLEQKDAELTRLRGEYAALRREGADTAADAARMERLELFRRVQSVLIQLPTAQAALTDGADLSAADFAALLAPIEEAFADLGFERIGEAGRVAMFDPRQHRAIGRKAAGLQPDERVRVRYVGYMLDGEIICKAEVTPSKASTPHTSA